MIKVLERSGIQGAYVNIMKAVDSRPTTNKVNREKLNMIPPKSETRQGVHSLHICSIQYSKF